MADCGVANRTPQIYLEPPLCSPAALYGNNGMMRISVELVPRGEAEVLADAMVVRAVMTTANAFNIPDLMRFPLRSWHACAISRQVLPDSIPHPDPPDWSRPGADRKDEVELT